MFASRLPLAERYAELLRTEGTLRGLIGPREGARIWDRHLLNCAVLAELLPGSGTVCDIGSGAGLPGIVLAIMRPQLRITLVEPLLRRTEFLDEAVEVLGLDNVEVVRGRAEALHGTGRFDVVTSRAVAPLPRLAAWSMPLVAPDGALLALKGVSAPEEAASAAKELMRHGASAPRVVEVGAGVVDPPVRVIRVVWHDASRVVWSDPEAGSSRTRPGRGRAGSRRRRPPR